MQLTLELQSARARLKSGPVGHSLNRQFFRLRCQPTRIWVGEWTSQESWYDRLIVRPVTLETMRLRGRQQVEAWRKDDEGHWEKFLTNAPLPQEGVEWIPLAKHQNN